MFKCENDAQEEGNQLLMIFFVVSLIAPKGRKSTMSNRTRTGEASEESACHKSDTLHKFYFQFAPKADFIDDRFSAQCI